MDPRIPSAAQLRYLLAALDHRSWRDAAASLGVTPSAFSQGMAELERRLGVTLFERQGRSRTPSPLAHVAAERARRIVAELSDLDRWAAEIREGTSGELRVGMTDTAAIWHFGDALAAFRRQNPAVGLRLVVQPSGRLAQLLNDGELDVVVGMIEKAPQVDVRPLVREPIHVYGPPGGLTADPTRWGPWVSFPADSRTRALVARALRAAGVPFDVIAESSQPAVLREMVRLGMGWTALTAVDAEREPHALQRARPEPITERVLSLARRSDRSISTAMRRLMDALIVAAERTP